MSFIKVYFALVAVVHVEAHDTANQYGYAQEQQAITEVACRIFYHADSRRAEEAAKVTNGVDLPLIRVAIMQMICIFKAKALFFVMHYIV